MVQLTQRSALIFPDHSPCIALSLMHVVSLHPDTKYLHPGTALLAAAALSIGSSSR